MLEKFPFVIPLAMLTIVTTGIVLYRRGGAFRAWVDSLSPRTLIAFHIIRAPIGLSFLYVYSLGLLPGIFAVRAGIGDTIVGLLAIAALFASPRLQRVWNVVGLIDIVMSVATAQKVLIIDRDPIALSTVQIFPFPLIPFVVVPLVVLSHLALFSKLRHLVSTTKNRASLRPTRMSS
jgi:hypothetical protein